MLDNLNMTPAQLEKWLDTDASTSVGDTSGKVESTGHASGRRIVETLQSKKGDLGDDDYAHMRRHLAQRPDGDITDTKWRYSLMNWGHEPER